MWAAPKADGFSYFKLFIYGLIHWLKCPEVTHVFKQSGIVHEIRACLWNIYGECLSLCAILDHHNINYLPLTILNNCPPSRCVSSLHLRLIEKNWSSLYSCQMCDAQRGLSLQLALVAAARGKQTLEWSWSRGWVKGWEMCLEGQPEPWDLSLHGSRSTIEMCLFQWELSD